MTGESLYWYWVAANSEFNVGVDAWGDLDHEDQAVWNWMAEKLASDDYDHD